MACHTDAVHEITLYCIRSRCKNQHSPVHEAKQADNQEVKTICVSAAMPICVRPQCQKQFNAKGCCGLQNDAKQTSAAL